jgi:hypothetical protein
MGDLPAEEKNFTGVRVTDDIDRTINVTATDDPASEEPSYYINYGRFVVPQEQRRGKMLLVRDVQTDEGPSDLVIPCFEAIRYFLGSSSNLLQLLFLSGLTGSNKVYNPKESFFAEEDKSVWVKLRKNIPDCDAQVVAWLVASKRFHWAATTLSNSLLFFQGKPAWPYFSFPILGNIDFEVRGLTIESQAGKRHFLVFELVYLRVSPPFLCVWHSRDNDGSQAQLSSPNPPKAWVGAFRNSRREVSDRESPLIVPGADAANDEREIVILARQYGSPFGKDDRIRMNAVPKHEQKSVGVRKWDTQAPPQEQASTSLYGVGQQGLSKAEFLPSKEKTPIACSYCRLFQRIFERLAVDPSLRCEWRQVSSPPSGDNYSEFHPQGILGRQGWRWLVRDGEKRVRRFYLFSVLHVASNRVFYFVEIERKSAKEAFSYCVLFRFDYGEIPIGDLAEIMEGCAEEEGRWRRLVIGGGIRKELLEHQTVGLSKSKSGAGESDGETRYVEHHRAKFVNLIGKGGRMSVSGDSNQLRNSEDASAENPESSPL